MEEIVVMLNIDLANVRKERLQHLQLLTTKEASKKFGVGVPPRGRDHIDGGTNAFFVEEKRKDVAFYPFIWELVYYMVWNF